MSPSQKPYIIDTNILINFRVFTPMNIHKTFWKQLSESVANGEIIIIKKVANECRDKEIKGWVKKQNITKVPVEIYARADAIDGKYKLITKKEGRLKSQADPVIIAYAEQKNCIVFTYESERTEEDQPMKIPDVCKSLDIECEREPSKVFEAINFQKI